MEHDSHENQVLNILELLSEYYPDVNFISSYDVYFCKWNIYCSDYFTYKTQEYSRIMSFIRERFTVPIFSCNIHKDSILLLKKNKSLKVIIV